MSEQLLPCPFCGSHALVNPGHRVCCTSPDCYAVMHAPMGQFDDDENAIKAWNTRATPPLAPCEPSAEPSLEEVERVFVEVSGLTIGDRGEVQDGWGYAREGLAAVRALCLRAREAPSAEFVKAADALRNAVTHADWCAEASRGECTCGLREVSSEYDRARALFVKEKLT